MICFSQFTELLEKTRPGNDDKSVTNQSTVSVENFSYKCSSLFHFSLKGQYYVISAVYVRKIINLGENKRKHICSY